MLVFIEQLLLLHVSCKSYVPIYIVIAAVTDLSSSRSKLFSNIVSFVYL